MARPRLPALRARDAKLLRDWVRASLLALRMTQEEIVARSSTPGWSEWREAGGAIATPLFGAPKYRNPKWFKNAMLNSRRLNIRKAMELYTRVLEATLVDLYGVGQRCLPRLPRALEGRIYRLWGQDMGIDFDAVNVYVSRKDIPALAKTLARKAIAKRERREPADRFDRFAARFEKYLTENAMRPPVDESSQQSAGVILSSGRRRERRLTAPG